MSLKFFMSPVAAALRASTAILMLMLITVAPAFAAAATVINWQVPNTITYGTPISTPATASSQGQPVAGTFAYNPPLSTVLPVGWHFLTATFTPASGGSQITEFEIVQVNRATLQVTSTATKAYGAPVPTLTPSYTGFVNGDTAAAVLTGSPSLTTSATSSSGVGSYTITVSRGSLASNNNYTLSYVNGTLTVTRATATVTLSGLSQTYNGNGRTATVTTTPTGLATSVTYNGSTTAPVNAGSYAVVATITNANYTGSATGTLVIAKANATVTLGALTHTYNGTGRAATVTTNPAGLTNAVTYAGNAALPINAGTYAVVATITNPNYNGTANGSLVINKANATVTLGALTHTYDGTGRAATVTTNPAGLATSVTYAGNAALPVNAGTYAVVATITNPNYNGSANGSLVINKANATVTLTNLSQTYDGTGRAATIATNPAGLANAVTYAGNAALPVNAGTYAVVATIINPNYNGSANGSLVINKANATVTLTNLSQTYDGTGRAATVTTNPAGLANAVTYAGNAALPINAGTYAVVATITDPNYNSGAANGSLVINKANATVTLGALTHTYNGTGRAATVTTNPAGLANSVTYAGNAALPVNAGTYAVVATITNPNYSGVGNGSLVINPAAATVTLGALTHTYNGTGRAATVTTNPAGLSHSITYAGNAALPINAGTYAVVATITNPNYSGVGNGSLVINPAAATVTLSALTHTYNGTGRAATVTTNPAGLSHSITYAGNAALPINAGTYAVVATITNPNYSGVGNGSLVINPAAATVTLGALTHTYNGTGRAATVTTNPAGLSHSITYAGNAALPINAGTYAVVATITNPNYTGLANGSLVINPATATVTLTNLTQTYDGTGRAATVTTIPAGLANSVTYAGNAALPVNAGTYAVVATITNPNYNGTANGSLVINKANATVTLTNLTQTYDGTGRAVTVATNPVGLANSVTYAGNAALPVNAGTYAVVATITNPNYNGTANGSLVINKANATVTLTNLTQTYDGTGRAATVTTNPAGLANSVTYAGNAALPINAGTYAVVATITDLNYNGTANGSLVINKANATVTLGALTHTYDGTGRAATVATNPAGLANAVTYAGNAALPVNAGTYAVVATVTDLNYNGTANGSLVINKANATVTLGALTHTYDGTGRAATVATNPAGLANAVTYAGNAALPVNAGTYAVVATITNPNYNGTANGSLMINKANATVTLTNLSQTYDGTGRAATVTTNPVGLATSVTYAGNAALPVNAGTYAGVATITDPNYNGVGNGSLVINPANATVTLTNLSQTYDGTGRAATVATNPVGVTTSVTYAGNAALPVNAGTYAVVATITDPNYNGVGNGSLVINPANATVTLTNLSQTYDGTGRAATIATNPAGLANAVTYAGNAALPINAGTYAVVATITNPNYNGVGNGSLVINQANATVTLTNLSQTYDGTGRAATVTTNPVGLSTSVTYAGYAALPVNAGTYAVVANITNPNYNGTDNASLVINKANATVTLGALTHTYDGNAHAITVTTVPASLPAIVTYAGSTTEPVDVGSYAVVATIDSTNHQGSAAGVLTIAQASQTITFADLSDTTVGSADQPLVASATSGLPVDFTIDGPAEIVAGALHVTAPGTVTITATQAGNTNWTGAAAVAQSITVSPTPGGGLLASYFANRYLNGTPALSRTDTQVNFDWVNGTPAIGVIPADNFSVRWDGEIETRFNEAYTLTFRTDDGVRVWFDGQLIVNYWNDRSVGDSNHTFTAQAGQRYRIRMEYYENGGQAVAKILWRSASESATATPVPSSQLYPTAPDTSGPIGTGTGLTGSYFANETLAGVPAVSRVDAGVNFDWAGGSPASGIPADSFSARWTGDIQPRYTEPYTVILRTDDGVRMWLDGQLVINDWFLRGAANSTYTFNAEAGRRYRIHIEYYEHFGSAVAQLQWFSAREFFGAVPATQLYPLPVPTVTVADVPQLVEGQPVSLIGTLSNTGDVPIALAWSQVAGPAAATFHAADQLTTPAHFPVAGTYTVRLSAFNGHVVVYDETTVSVIATDVNSGLVAHYTFDEASGTQVFDSSGKSHTGVLYGATTRTTGKQGGGLRFTNTSSFVYVQGNEDLDPAAPALTLAAWLKPDRTMVDMAAPAPMPIYRADYPNSMGYALMILANETDRLGMRIHHLAGAGQRLETFTNQPLVANTWVHAAAVLNASTMTMYLNGVPVASRATNGAIPRAGNELALFIGRGFEGVMDDVRIYHRALSVVDVAGLAQGGLDRQAPQAEAGPDQVLTLPSTTVTLLGSASDDAATGTLSANWIQVAGPAAATFNSTNTLTPQVTVTVPGTYRFELAVSDGMLIGRDLVRVEVSPEAVDLTGGLVLHYRLDDGSGALAQDASSYALTANFYGTPQWSPDGEILGAARLNGLSQIIAPVPNHLGSLTTMTLSLWMHGDRALASMTHPWPSALYHADYSLNRGFALMTTANETNLFGMRLHTGTGRREVTMDGIPAGSWVHVVATFDGQTMRLYRDGALVGRNETGPITVPAFEAPLQIGIGYEGLFDDIRIYNRALSPAEVQSLGTVVPLGGNG